MRQRKLVSPRSIERITVLNGGLPPITLHKRKNKAPKNLKELVKTDGFKRTARTAAALTGIVRAVRVANGTARPLRRPIRLRAGW